MYAYLKNSAQQAAEREKAVYDKLLAQYHQLLFAATEGVYEITIRSQSGSVVVPVDLRDGMQITHDLIERFSKRVDKIESDLNATISEVGAETGDELAKHLVKAREHEASIQRNLEAIAQYNALPSLAKQAVASAAPTQKGPGRPRKTHPQPEVAATLGQAAAEVPMNGSTAHAAARATNLPQG